MFAIKSWKVNFKLNELWCRNVENSFFTIAQYLKTLIASLHKICQHAEFFRTMEKPSYYHILSSPAFMFSSASLMYFYKIVAFYMINSVLRNLYHPYFLIHENNKYWAAIVQIFHILRDMIYWYCLSFLSYKHFWEGNGIYLSVFCGTNLNSKFLTNWLLEDNKFSFLILPTTVSVICQLAVLYSTKCFTC